MSHDVDVSINRSRLSRSRDPSILVFGLRYVGFPQGEVGDEAVEECEISYCDNVSSVGESDDVLITVSTPNDEFDTPETILDAAGRTIGESLTKETTVVLESTYDCVYRGPLPSPHGEPDEQVHERPENLGYPN